MAKTQELIKYEQQGEWGGYTLAQRADGLWVHDQWSAIQGHTTGRRVVIEPPSGWTVEDAEDLDTWSPDAQDGSKAERLIRDGREVRCLRRGCTVN